MDGQSLEVIDPNQQEVPFNIIVPEPFSLKNHSDENKTKLRSEVMDKERLWENDMSKFFRVCKEYAMNWRIQSDNDGARKSRGLSNCKSGETHKSVIATATLWFRMLTASDNFFQMVAQGFDPFGMPLSETDIYGAEQVIIKQMRRLAFKRELLDSLNSLALFGSLIFELSWVRELNPDGMTWFEGTKMSLRPLVSTAFDTSCYDINQSDYIIPIDYLSKWKIRSLMNNDPEFWDKETVEEQLKDENSKGNSKNVTNVLNNINERRQRAGYNTIDKDKSELISYLGRVDSENPIISEYWDKSGFEGDPKDYDFSIKILNGDALVYFSHAPYGSWHTKYKSCTYKKFELEPLGYGVGSLGARTQKDLDTIFSRTQDQIHVNTYGMWLLGRYAGVKPSQLMYKPQHVIEIDQMDQIQQLKQDVNLIQSSLNFQALLREEIRANNNTSGNLQAQITKATATESGIVQNEAMRANSVYAEVIGEPLMRETVEQMHINNLNHLDSPIWVNVTGKDRKQGDPRFVDKNNLPMNIGVEIKLTTDKDYRPERSRVLLEGAKAFTSVRNWLPPSINPVPALIEEWFRSVGLNPDLLRQAKSMKDELFEQLKLKMGNNVPTMDEEIQSELGQEQVGGVDQLQTPMGNVSGSVNAIPYQGDMSAV